MADTKTSDESAASALTGVELVRVVQGGANRRTTTQGIADLAPAPAVGAITGLGTGIAAALAVNVGSAGAPVALNGALGTPTSGMLTNCTGIPEPPVARLQSAYSFGGL